MMRTARRKRTKVWQGCYSASWKGLIVEDAFAHPAKMSRSLVARIFEHLFERGYVTRGSLIVDPFGGIGATAIEGASRGCRVICCELEPKFVDLAKRNFELHRATWQACGDPLPVMVQGDSRRLVDVVGPVLADAAVGSPPFIDARQDTTNSVPTKKGGPCAERLHTVNGVDAVCGSPPFSGTEQPCASQTRQIKDYHAFTRGHGTKRDATMTGGTPGQLGAMETGSVDAVCSSPPYAESSVTGDRNFIGGGGRETAAAEAAQGYGNSEGNLANLPAGIVSSPPWEKGAEGKLRGEKFGNREAFVDKMLERDAVNPGTHRRTREAALAQMDRDAGKIYGTSNGQLGNDTGETFWSASRIIVAQCFAILKPGGVAVWVTKRFCRDGKIVDFDADWRRLCESVGFETIEIIHASLVKKWTESTLFDGDVQRKKERKSFFRRLHEKKRPDLSIDYETVSIMRKPA